MEVLSHLLLAEVTYVVQWLPGPNVAQSQNENTLLKVHICILKTDKLVLGVQR